MTTIQLISVIVCTRNRADLLPGVISQLRSQDYPSGAYEIVIVDNGSTDHTPQVVRQFIDEPGVPVRYVVESASGITAARNRGAQEANYPYLAYLDDDCKVGKDWLYSLVQGFNQHANVVAVGGRIVLDWSNSERPVWLGSGLESWLGANSRLGPHPRLLDDKSQIMEGNMALKQDAWKTAGGFMGMEQFGSQNMSAGEVLYLLHRFHKQGQWVAFAPQAVAFHQVGTYTRRKFLQRGYWQGVSDGILDYLVYRRSLLVTIGRIVLDTCAMLVLISYTSLFCITANQAKSMEFLVRALRRLGLIVSQARLAGNWPRVRSWIATHNEITSQ